MMLHLINKSPWNSRALEDCLRLAAPSDALLLLEDGVYSATTAFFLSEASGVRLYALDEDVQARGLGSKILPNVERINYTQFVGLTVEYTRIQSWY